MKYILWKVSYFKNIFRNNYMGTASREGKSEVFKNFKDSRVELCQGI